LIALRAAEQKVVGSQTSVDKSRGGKISFMVKTLPESIIVFSGPGNIFLFIDISCSSTSLNTLIEYF
jgi:hypothetical protein